MKTPVPSRRPDPSVDPSRMLEELKERAEQGMRNSLRTDLLIATVVACLVAVLVFVLVGRECMHEPETLSAAGHSVSVCEDHGPWLWTRLVWCLLGAAALVFPIVFRGIRALRRRRLWS